MSRVGREWKVLVLVSVAAAGSGLDLSLMFVAFPEIQRSFDDVSAAQISWVLTSFTIVAASLLIVAGRFADQFGRRRVFLTGLALFASGSALSGAAPMVELLIAARVVQAIGGAMLTPSSLALIMSTFPPEKRSAAIGFWSTMSGVVVSAAPTIGSGIIQLSSWRWAFYINVPLGAVCWVLARRIVPESVAPDAEGVPDLVGVGQILLGVALLAFAIVQTDEWGWIDPRTAAPAALAVLVMVWFGRRCARHPRPVVDPELFRSAFFRSDAVAALSVGACFFGAYFVFIQFLTRVWGFSIVETGLAVTPMSAASSVVGYPAGRLMDRWGPGVVMMPGALCLGLGCVWLLRADADPAVLTIWVPAMALVGLGVGMLFPGVNSAVAHGVDAARLGTAAAVVQTLIRIGGTLGAAIGVAVLGDDATDLADYRLMFSFIACGCVVVLGATAGLVRAQRVPAVRPPSTRNSEPVQ
ncbi:MAG: MFS transporter [Acidimicrobiales bacterium]|nr:MFS transporter [Acidimicrobiales bacterium]